MRPFQFFMLMVVAAAFSGAIHKPTSVTAYYADGSWVRYTPDPATQVIRTVSSDGTMDASWHGIVVDAQNWTDPMVHGHNGTINWEYGALIDVDGHLKSTDPKMAKAPISWLRWEWLKLSGGLKPE